MSAGTGTILRVGAADAGPKVYLLPGRSPICGPTADRLYTCHPGADVLSLQNEWPTGTRWTGARPPTSHHHDHDSRRSP